MQIFRKLKSTYKFKFLSILFCFIFLFWMFSFQLNNLVYSEDSGTSPQFTSTDVLTGETINETVQGGTMDQAANDLSNELGSQINPGDQVNMHETINIPDMASGEMITGTIEVNASYSEDGTQMIQETIVRDEDGNVVQHYIDEVSVPSDDDGADQDDSGDPDADPDGDDGGVTGNPGGWLDAPIDLQFSKGSGTRHMVNPGAGWTEQDPITIHVGSSGIHEFEHIIETETVDNTTDPPTVTTSRTSSTETVYMDLTPPNAPSVSVNSAWSRGPVPFSITGGDDEHSGLAYLQYRVRGGWTTGNSGSINTHGTHTIGSRAIDNVGLETIGGTGTARVDKRPPRISFSPSSGTFINQSNIARITVTDSYSGVNHGSLRYSWSSASIFSQTQWSSFSSGQTITREDSLGDFYIRARSSDNVGNNSTARGGPYYIDNKIVRLNIQPVRSNGGKLREVMGYEGQSGSHILKMDLEMDGGDILLRDDNTNEVRVDEDFMNGIRLNIDNDFTDIIDITGAELLNDVPLGYSADGPNSQFLRIDYDLKEITPDEGIPTTIYIGFERDIGVVTPPEPIEFITWITQKEPDSN